MSSICQFMPSAASTKSSLTAKKLVSQTRNKSEGLRALAPKDRSPTEQAVSRLDDRLVRLLVKISVCALEQDTICDGSVDPSSLCHMVAAKVVQDLYLAYRMHPVRVAASVEGGIMLVFRDHPNLELEIEVDNDGDVTGVISTEDHVLMSAMITLPAEFSRLVTTYRLSTASSLQRQA